MAEFITLITTHGLQRGNGPCLCHQGMFWCSLMQYV